MKHLIPRDFRRNIVKVDLVGCGGTGSQLLSNLARLHVSLLAAGHPHGLYVTTFDPDHVSVANMARQLYAPSDIGQPKATVLTTRVNCFYGLEWASFPMEYDFSHRFGHPPDIVITAVDSLRARAEIYRQLRSAPIAPPRYWLDLGNAEDTGQVILGEVEWLLDPWDGDERRRKKRLRNVTDVFPDMLERAETEEPEPESCSLAVALGKQSLFINAECALWGGQLLWRLFRDGGLEWHGVFINAKAGQVQRLMIEPMPEISLPAPQKARRPRRLTAGRTAPSSRRYRPALTAGGAR